MAKPCCPESSISVAQSPVRFYLKKLWALTSSPTVLRPLPLSSATVSTAAQTWQAHVEPDGRKHQGGVYIIHFQVWRPSSIVESSGLVERTGKVFGVEPEPTNRISIRPGDVVGYYFFVFDKVEADSGIQLHDTMNNEEIWYHVNNNEQNILMTAESCPFPVGNGGILHLWVQ